MSIIFCQDKKFNHLKNERPGETLDVLLFLFRRLALSHFRILFFFSFVCFSLADSFRLEEFADNNCIYRLRMVSRSDIWVKLST